MKLNHDCVRSVLLHLEDSLQCEYDERYRSIQFLQTDLKILFKSKLANEYLHEDILYSILQLKDAGFIDAQNPTYIGGNKIVNIVINGITYEGNKFLDTIREDKIWADTKTRVAKIGKTSLDVMSQIALAIGVEYFKANCGLS